MSQTHQKIGIFLSLVVGFTALYWVSTSPVPAGYADSDELLTTSYLFGVAHPPGFALFTTLTAGLMRVFTKLSPALVGNAWVGLLQAVTLGLLYMVSLSLWPKTKKGKGPLKHLATVTAIVSLGLSYFWWLYATIYEVVAWTNLLAVLLMLGAWQWYGHQNGRSAVGWFMATWAIAGVAIGHNPLLALFFPGLLVLLIFGWKRRKTSWRSAIGWFMTGLVAMGLALIISNLPLFTQMNQQAAVSWYVPPKPVGWVNHLLRQDLSGFSYDRGVTYNAYNLSPTLINGQAVKAGLDYFRILVEHLGWWMVGAGLVGIGWLLKRDKLTATVLLLWFGLTGPILNAYMGASPPTFQVSFFAGVSERQLLMSEMVFSLFIALGLNPIFKWLSRQGGRWGKTLAVMIAVGLIGWQGWTNRTLLTNKTNRTLVSSYAQAALTQAEENAIVICTSDIDCYSLMYASTVEGSRPDVTVLPHVSTYRVWYLKGQPDIYPTDQFSEPDFLKNLIEFNYSQRPIYLTNGVGFYPEYIGWEKGPYFLKPDGLLFRLTDKVPKISAKTNPVLSMATRGLADRRDTYFTGIREVWGNTRAYAGYLALLYGQPDQAKIWLNQARELDPNSAQAQDMLSNLKRYTRELKL